jgi:hypothetical protein
MKIKIVSDGYPRSTKIYDEDTGEDLTKALRITGIEWGLKLADSGRGREYETYAVLTLARPRVEIHTEIDAGLPEVRDFGGRKICPAP